MVSQVQDIDRGYDDMLATLRSMTGVQILVGVRPDGGDPDIAQIAEWQEFGTKDGHVPERSFLRATVDERKTLIANLLTDAVKKVVRGAKPKNAYGQVGRRVVFEVQRRISSRIDPPNAPSTIAKKGSDKPLIDTGHLHTSIDYEVIP